MVCKRGKFVIKESKPSKGDADSSVIKTAWTLMIFTKNKAGDQLFLSCCKNIYPQITQESEHFACR